MKRMDADIRIRVFERDGYTCRYCGDTKGPFHADHVYPYVKGGETTMENMVTACAGCNSGKHDTVGIWPKPIGYFSQKKHSPEITILTMFGVLILVNGALFHSTIAMIIGMAVSILSIAWNLTRR